MFEIRINKMIFIVFGCSISCFLHNRTEEINYVIAQCNGREVDILTS